MIKETSYTPSAGLQPIRARQEAETLVPQKQLSGYRFIYTLAFTACHCTLLHVYKECTAVSSSLRNRFFLHPDLDIRLESHCDHVKPERQAVLVTKQL